MIRLINEQAELDFDPAVGNIPLWRVDGRLPLHSAPWRDESDVQAMEDLAAVNKRLAGDFFCMPFGLDDVHGHPPHGPMANLPWQLGERTDNSATLTHSTGVEGASVTKIIRLDGASLLQTHIVDGGQGALTFAHHPMSHMRSGGQLSFSPKRAVLTDPNPQYEGHNLWRLNQLNSDLSLSLEHGGEASLHRYPMEHEVEDFCLLVEQATNGIGWTCLMRDEERDMLLVLKDTRLMPVTMLWISNGGRDFAPWNGRHRGVIGIEDGRAMGGEGLAAALVENRLTRMGIPTVLPLGARHVIKHAMVSLPRPDGWSRLDNVEVRGDELVLTEADGQSLSVAFDGAHFA